MRDIGALAGRKVVQADDLGAQFDQSLGEVGADEARGSGDQDLAARELRLTLHHDAGLAVAPLGGQRLCRVASLFPPV